MRILILVFVISRLCECSLPPYYGVTVGLSANARPVVSQYHRQDNYGQYVYGYATDLSSQDEVKTPDGVTRGGYSYIDANGILQTVQYISDPVNGFRVLATNIPRDLPEVAHARAEHLAQFEHIKAEHASIAASRKYEPILSVSPAPGSYIVPVKTHVVAPAPPTPIHIQPIVVQEPLHTQHVQVAAPVQAVAYTPAVAVSSQYHAQDSLGQYSYGYADPNSAKSETKTADGVTRGGYSYIDANGILQTVHYISDPVNGFRVSATNLPKAPSVTLIGPKVTTTVVGPKDTTNTVAAADTVISSVPIHSPAVVVDSFAIEQKPALTQVDIVQHANVPITSPQGGPYIHPNPNHETPVVYTNPELTAPFEPPHTPAHINPQVYNAPPIPVTHTQSIPYNNNQDTVYGAAPYNPELAHHVHSDQSIIPLEQSFSHNQQHEQQIHLSGEHGGPHAQVYVQPNHPQPQQVLIAPDAHGTQEYIPVAHNHEHAPQQVFVASPNVQSNHAYGHQQNIHDENQQIYITPEGHVSNHGNEHQQIYLSGGSGQHENQQVLLSSGEHREQIYADPNHVHAGHSIQLGPEHQQRANYYYGGGTEYTVPTTINAEAINNNGPTNQQVLNHGSVQSHSHSQLAYEPQQQTTDDSAAYSNSAYEGAYSYGENPAVYAKQIPDGTGAAAAVPQVQQVYQQTAPVGHGPQVVASNHDQHAAAFLLHQGEHQHQEHSLQANAHAQEAQAYAAPQAHAHEAQQHATAPSGYYTHNIQY